MNNRHHLSFGLTICLMLMLFGIGQVYAQSFQSAVVGQVTDAAGG